MSMARLNIFNNDQQTLHAAMGPRISFSNDFVDTQQPIKHENSYREAPVSSDFEFSVSGYNMISADELFSKGKIVPTKITLKDELLVEDDYADMLPRLAKGMSRWKERLGLKRSHTHHLRRKSADKNITEVLERIDETNTTLSFHEDVYAANIKGAQRRTLKFGWTIYKEVAEEFSKSFFFIVSDDEENWGYDKCREERDQGFLFLVLFSE